MTRVRLWMWIVTAAMFLGLGPEAAHAQEGRAASLTGQVIDVTGGVVPQASVVARRTSTGLDRRVDANAEGVFSIPDLQPDWSVDNLKVSQEAKWLVGFWLNRGIASPRKSPSKWMRDGIRPGSFWGPRVRHTIASQVDSIRHWQVHNCSYLECPTPRAATWFVDPPYEGAGRHYRFGSAHIDFAALAAWCKSRPGQVIVCENKGATWLPFRELADVKTTRADRRSREVMWLNTWSAGNGHRQVWNQRGR